LSSGNKASSGIIQFEKKHNFQQLALDKILKRFVFILATFLFAIKAF
jgi:preprotein translocase subunit SecG